MSNNQSKNIDKIINRIDSIIDYCSGCSNLEDFQNNSMLVEACVFNLTQIGELVTKISEETKNLNKDIPWKDISGMRNKIVHDYFSINLNIVWDTIQNDLPNLKCDMEKLYNNYRTDEFKPNDETIATMKEIDEMEKHPEMYKGNTDINAMFDEILKDS